MAEAPTQTKKVSLATITSDDPEKRREWQERGTILGIAASVGGTSCSHILYLTAMFALIKTKHDALMKCEDIHVRSGTQWMIGEYLCEYTKAYVECFPELSLTVCLLVIGRNLLQQRMYYGLLERSAVLQYKAKNFFADGMVRFFLWCYAHCIGHLFLIGYVIWQNHAEDALLDEVQSEAGEQKFVAHVAKQAFLGFVQQPSAAARDPDSVLNHQISLLVELIGFFVVPATLFLVYLCLSYDIELSLVPLSQYFYDARKAAQVESEEKAAKAASASSPVEDTTAITGGPSGRIESKKDWICSAQCELTVIDDDALKLMVEDKQEHLLDAKDTVEETYDVMIKMYQDHGWKYEKTAQETGETFIGLSFAHWPARILVSEDDHFRYIWLIYVAVSLTGQCFMCYSLTWLIRLNSWNFLDTGRWPALLYCAVVLTNVLAQLWGLWVNSLTIGQWFQHGQFRRPQNQNLDSAEKKEGGN